MPVTRAPTCTLTPRLRNDRATTPPTSLSVGARMRGSASIIVTSLPMSTSIDANSTPITPPPMMATRGGSSVRLSTWSDERTRTPSKSSPGSALGVEPVAIRRFAPGHLGAVGETHPVSGGVDDLTARRVQRDVAAAQQGLDPLRQAVDHLLLATLRSAQIERGETHLHAEVVRGLDGPQHLGRLEQLLGRHAAPVQARPADAVLLHQRDIEAGGRSVERRAVAGGSAAEHYQIVVLAQDGHLLISSRCASR